MAAALARVVGGGAAARLSLAEMMGVRGARVAPEARRSRASRAACRPPADGSDEKPDASPILPLMVNLRRGRLPHLARDRHRLADAAHQARLPQNWTLLHRSARERSRNSSDHRMHHAAPRDPAGPAPRRAPEVDGRHDAPRRVDLEPREQVHW